MAQVRVEMGEEPAHFLSMFDGALVTLLGGVERGQQARYGGCTTRRNHQVLHCRDEDGVMMLRVFSQCNAVGDRKPLVRAQQVQEVETQLTDQEPITTYCNSAK